MKCENAAVVHGTLPKHCPTSTVLVGSTVPATTIPCFKISKTKQPAIEGVFPAFTPFKQEKTRQCHGGASSERVCDVRGGENRAKHERDSIQQSTRRTQTKFRKIR
jgi:hypothetical protein